jgi:hypothetical protein
MIRSAVLASGGVIALTVSAAADYSIVQGPDGHCRVVEHYNPNHPRNRDTVRIGPLGFRDRAEAEREMKVVCQDGYYYQEEARGEEHNRQDKREGR